ncbi:MAG TPA: VOC family protein [Hyphomicrobiaceae bacterium]|nr:VOC family protein [Hyphomicrobiaceae bacterium]
MYADADPRGTIVPTLRCRDVPAAMDWLCKAFAFEPHFTVTGEDGAVRYAELTYGDGMVMLGPAEEAPGSVMTQPTATGGAETQICYLFVADPRAHCDRARAAGAEIILGIDDEASGGRGYSCRDPEGHVWSFGTYDPWKRSAPRGNKGLAVARAVGTPLRLAFVASLMAAMLASAGLAGWALGVTHPQSDPEHVAAPASPRERSANVQSQNAVMEAKQSLAAERRAREAAERAAREMAAQLAQERSAREAAERAAAVDNGRALDEAREQLAREKTAIESLRRAAQEIRERLALAERSAEAVREQLAAERSARAAAEQASLKIKEQLDKERQAREAREREVKEAEERAARAERAKHVRAAGAKRTYYRYRIVPVASRTRWSVNWDEIIR